MEGFGEQLASPRTPPTTLAVTSTGAVEPAAPLPPPGKAREMAWASGRYAARCEWGSLLPGVGDYRCIKGKNSPFRVAGEAVGGPLCQKQGPVSVPPE